MRSRFCLTGPQLPPCVRLAPWWRRHPVGTAAAGVCALAALLTHASPRLSDHEQFHNRVFQAVDVPGGDRVVIAGPAGERTVVRLVGLAAADDPDATAYVRARLMGQPVRVLLCRRPTRDADGRLLAYLEDPQTGASHNEAILEAGWASPDEFAHPRREASQRTSQKARDAQRGRWAK